VKLYKYTEQQLREAIHSSESCRQVLQKLGVSAFGGNYDTFRKAIKHFNIDTSHFLGQGWLKGKAAGPKRPIEKYLNNEHWIGSHKLRLRLIS
jgi:TPP-dependent indolepyruvate ferredoxin oxidoreductase alpha subunit